MILGSFRLENYCMRIKVVVLYTKSPAEARIYQGSANRHSGQLNHAAPFGQKDYNLEAGRASSIRAYTDDATRGMTPLTTVTASMSGSSR